MSNQGGHLSGRHCIVTGGGGVLGSAVVREILEKGGTVAVPCADEREQQRVHEVGYPEGRVRAVVAGDLSTGESTKAFYDEYANGPNGSPLWASIHIAGGFAMSSLGETRLSDFDRMMRMNAYTCFVCCREAARAMRLEGRIVNVAAKPALVPEQGAGMAAYAASKAAVVSLTLSLAEELKQQNIWVNAVAPSIMDTPSNRSAMPEADHGNWPGVDDVAQTIAFLASPLNRVSRGAIVPVYGRS